MAKQLEHAVERFGQSHLAPPIRRTDTKQQFGPRHTGQIQRFSDLLVNHERTAGLGSGFIASETTLVSCSPCWDRTDGGGRRDFNDSRRHRVDADVVAESKTDRDGRRFAVE
ncbi:hypothetical protein ATC00_24640 [Sinorhizobium americanum]|nr:hypothetical protein ATC00_24640 [Sinorhizobium americanum]